MTRGLFISLEGGEGSGKTTQIKAIQAALTAQGRDVVVTREPGGTKEAEKIRALLVQRDGGDWSPEAECLLFFAARAMHVRDLIRPALDRGQVVITDRFTDSTRAYQACGRQVDKDWIERLNALVLGDFAPDLTLILDLPVETGLRRSGRRLAASTGDGGHAEDRFERLDLDFHHRMRDGYLAVARAEPERCCVIDADRPADAVTRDILATIGTIHAG